MSAPADWLYGFYSDDNLKATIENEVKVSLVGDILGILYHDILREKEGGVYSPQVGSTYNVSTGRWNLVYFLQTNEEQSAQMLQLADELFVNLLKDGATPEQFNRMKMQCCHSMKTLSALTRTGITTYGYMKCLILTSSPNIVRLLKI